MLTALSKFVYECGQKREEVPKVSEKPIMGL